MKVCVLANSHVAMLKQASDKTSPTGWVPTYFAAQHTMMGKLRASVDGRGLATKSLRLRKHLKMTSGGLSRVNFDDFDAFACVGLTIKVQTAYLLFEQYQPLRYRLSDDVPLISEDAFRAAVKARYTTTSGAKLLALLAKVGKTVLFIPSPIPNQTFIDMPENAWAKTQKGQAALAWMNDLCREIWQEMATEYGATLILQPPKTIGDNHLTRADYNKGARGIRGQDYEQRDATHMNADFGQIVLDQITDALATTPATASA